MISIIAVLNMFKSINILMIMFLNKLFANAKYVPKKSMCIGFQTYIY